MTSFCRYEPCPSCLDFTNRLLLLSLLSAALVKLLSVVIVIFGLSLDSVGKEEKVSSARLFCRSPSRPMFPRDSSQSLYSSSAGDRCITCTYSDLRLP